jgi:hypothetical protein
MLSPAGLIPLTDPNWDSVKFWQSVCFLTSCRLAKSDTLHLRSECEHASDAENNSGAVERVGP